MSDSNDELLHGLASFVAHYVRCATDPAYDALESSKFGKKARSLSPTTRRLLQGGFFAAAAYVDIKFKSDTPLKRFVKSLVREVPYEFGRRVTHDVRQEIQADLPFIADAKERSAVESLLRLSDEELAAVLAWLATVNPKQREDVAEKLAEFSAEDLSRIARLSTEQKKTLLTLLGAEPLVAETKQVRFPVLRESLEADVHRAEAKLAALRKRREAKDNP